MYNNGYAYDIRDAASGVFIISIWCILSILKVLSQSGA